MRFKYGPNNRCPYACFFLPIAKNASSPRAIMTMPTVAMTLANSTMWLMPIPNKNPPATISPKPKLFIPLTFIQTI